MTTIPTEIWAAVGGADKCVHHACTWAQGCHEHINDAIAEHDIEDAKAWVVRRYALAEWQPIKTAPRDGTNILLACGQDGVSQGKFIPGLPKPWQFIDTNDGITWLINHAVDNEYGPTHWLPMPQWARPTRGATTCRAEPRGSGEWVCDCTQMRPDCKPNAGVKVAPAPVDVRQLRRTLESVARCLERNDWGTAHDRVQDALALLPDGVSEPGQQTFSQETAGDSGKRPNGAER